MDRLVRLKSTTWHVSITVRTILKSETTKKNTHKKAGRTSSKTQKESHLLGRAESKRLLCFSSAGKMHIEHLFVFVLTLWACLCRATEGLARADKCHRVHRFAIIECMHDEDGLQETLLSLGYGTPTYFRSDGKAYTVLLCCRVVLETNCWVHTLHLVCCTPTWDVSRQQEIPCQIIHHLFPWSTR